MIGNALKRRGVVALAGLAGCAIGTAALIAPPSAGRLEARERGVAAACRTEQVELDRGYGVTRIAERRVCDER